MAQHIRTQSGAENKAARSSGPEQKPRDTGGLTGGVHSSFTDSTSAAQEPTSFPFLASEPSSGVAQRHPLDPVGPTKDWRDLETRPIGTDSAGTLASGSDVVQRKALDSGSTPGDWRERDLRPMAARIGRTLAKSDAVQRSAERKEAARDASIDPGVQKEMAQSRGAGTPLPRAVRSQMDSSFNKDFSDVRIHNDGVAPALGARAVTRGSDIHLGPGEPGPSSRSGRELLGHELTHVVQQRQGQVSVPAQAKGAALNEDSGLEAEADAMGALAADGKAIPGMRSAGAAADAYPQDPAVQAKKLSASKVVKALRTIPFVEKKLGQHLTLRRGSEQSSVEESMLEHVTDVLKQYDKHFKNENEEGVHHAMLLAVVLEAVARIIAVNELNDPALTSKLALDLLDAYSDEIRSALSQKKMEDTDDVLDLTAGLVMDDPVSQYMHHEIRSGEAARKVRLMASVAGTTPEQMFLLLRQKFEAKMATLDKETVKKQEDSSDTYSVKNASGEISSEHFETLFGSQVPKPKWKKSKGQDNKKHWHLQFAQGSSERLDKLAQIVSSTEIERPNLQETEGLTYKQQQHLGRVEEKDNKAKQDQKFATREQEVASGLASLLGGQEQAVSVLQRVKEKIGELPITITVQAMPWFGTKVPDQEEGDTVYKAGSSRRFEKQKSELFEKEGLQGTVKHLGEWQKPEHLNQERGKNYYRFRNWKDQMMTSKLGFSDKELPAFGAVNLNWPAHSSKSTKKEEYGVNSYGDTHFILKKSAIAERMVYTATDHGQPHVDPYLTFLDFVSGGKSMTGLKSPKHQGAALQVINSIMTKKKLNIGVQVFEVQIFGKLDIARDVSQIVVAPSVTNQTARTNIETFCTTHSIQCQFLNEPQETVMSRSWFYFGKDQQDKTFKEQIQAKLDRIEQKQQLQQQQQSEQQQSEQQQPFQEPQQKQPSQEQLEEQPPNKQEK